ncbi:MAG TPA: hypothetical protein VIO43_04055 [Lutibacter sp.]
MSLLKSNCIILKEFNLLIECHSGNLNLQSYVDFVKRTSHDPLFSKILNYFIDLSDVVVTVSLDDVEKYNNFTIDNFKWEKKKKVALITETPNQMVFATLFKNSNMQKLKEIEVFSTKENALEWLNSSFDKNEIFSVLSNLRGHSLK